MILLDTNIVSDTVRVRPNPKVQAWINTHDAASLWISAVTIAELRVGIELMDDGRKKSELRLAIDRAIHLFGRQCAPFDALAANEFARIVAARKRIGRPIEALDAQIAAVAITTGFSLATLDLRGFEKIDGLTVIDPSA
jgi:predicted nucleic acid-binding protein